MAEIASDNKKGDESCWHWDEVWDESEGAEPDVICGLVLCVAAVYARPLDEQDPIV